GSAASGARTSCWKRCAEKVLRKTNCRKCARQLGWISARFLRKKLRWRYSPRSSPNGTKDQARRCRAGEGPSFCFSNTQPADASCRPQPARKSSQSTLSVIHQLNAVDAARERLLVVLVTLRNLFIAFSADCVIVPRLKHE